MASRQCQTLDHLHNLSRLRQAAQTLQHCMKHPWVQQARQGAEVGGLPGTSRGSGSQRGT